MAGAESPSARRWITAPGHRAAWLAGLAGLVVIALLVRVVGLPALRGRIDALGARLLIVLALESPRVLVADALAWWVLLGYRRPRGVGYGRLCLYSLAGYAITNG